MKITENELRPLLLLRKERDLSAAKIGAAFLEFEKAKEYYKHQIDISLIAERKLGNPLLERYGLTNKSINYKIDDKGCIMEMKNGDWIPVED